MTKITETTAEEAEAATVVPVEVVEAVAAAVVEVAEAVVVEAEAATTIDRNFLKPNLLHGRGYCSMSTSPTALLFKIQQSVIFLFRVILTAQKSFFPFSSTNKLFRASSTISNSAAAFRLDQD